MGLARAVQWRGLACGVLGVVPVVFSPFLGVVIASVVAAARIASTVESTFSLFILGMEDSGIVSS